MGVWLKLRRLDLLPSSSVQLPVYIQLSEEVEPSSLSTPKVGIELTALVLLVAHLAVGPEEAIDTTSPLASVVLVRPVHLEDGSGNVPPSALYSSRILLNKGTTIRKLAGFTARLYALIKPPQPATAIAAGAFFFNAMRRGQDEYFSLAGLGVYARAHPVIRGFRIMELRAHEPVQLIQGRLASCWYWGSRSWDSRQR